MKSFRRKAALLVAASLVATVIPMTGVENVKVGEVNHLIINQVYGTGEKTDTPIKSSFIELYNPTSGEVSLSGYSIVYGDNVSSLDFS